MSAFLRRIEPLVWPVFGGGFFAVAFFYPSWAVVVGLADAVGWLPDDALSFERMIGLATTPIGRLLLAAAIVLPLWNGAFHLRHTLMDLLGTESDRFGGPILYAVAALGSIATGFGLWRL